MAAPRRGQRDTAKDIMLGTAPSGLGPKLPRDTVRRPPPPKPAPPPRAETTFRNLPPIPTPAAVPPPDPRPVLDPTVIARLSSAEKSNRSLMEELMKLQNEFRTYQRHNTDALNQEQEARRRLEGALRSSSDANANISNRLKTAESGAGSLAYMKQDLDESKRARAQLEADLFRTQQDLSYLKGVVERQADDLMMLNSEVKSRPHVDPSQMNNTQHLESDVRGVHGQLMTLRHAMDSEVQERRRVDQEHHANLSRLQAQMADQEARKQEIMRALVAQENSKNSISEEARRLNAKIGLITDEVTRNMMAKEQQLRDEGEQQYLVLEKAIKAELEARLQYERDVKMYIDQRWKQYHEQIELLRNQLAAEKEKQKQQMASINESLATMEKHLEQGNRKVDRVLAAEIQSRRLNEKAMLSKLGEIEDILNGHVGHLNGALDDVKRGMKVEPPPPLDTDALRNELEAIASDKHKLSMEGLLKLEERMNRIEQGMDRDTRELKDKFNKLEGDHHDTKNAINDTKNAINDTKNAINATDAKHKDHDEGRQIDQDSLARIRHQIQKLDDAQHEIGRAHDKLKDRVENQIPKDIEELDVKNKQRHDQLSERVEKEEKTRYIAVKDLEDEIAKLKNRPVRNIANGGGTGGPNVDVNQHANEKVQREVDECQVGIKKLAESVTTVKNVLDRKITEEARTREKEIDEVHKRIESFE